MTETIVAETTLKDKERTRLLNLSTIDLETRCWNWKGTSNGRYGRITIGSRTDGSRAHIPAHRYSYEMFVGEIPEDLWVLHHCDNTFCINPDHLYTGTRQDNTDDRERRGRNNPPRGEDAVKAKLTEEQVVEIYERCQDGEGLRPLAREFGVNHKTIWQIRERKSWVHVLPQPPKEG